MQAFNILLWMEIIKAPSKVRFYTHYTVANISLLLMIPIYAPASMKHLSFACINLMVLFMGALLDLFAKLSTTKTMVHLTVLAFLQMLVSGLRWSEGVEHADMITDLVFVLMLPLVATLFQTIYSAKKVE